MKTDLTNDNIWRGLFAAVVGIVFSTVFSYAPIAVAEDDALPLYDIEVLVFKQLSKTDEFWDRDVVLQWPETVVSLDDNDDLQAVPKQLQGVNKRLTKTWGFRVLWHQAWQQQGLSIDEAPWVFVQGGYPKYGRHELEGAVQVYLSRYLHLRSNLWFTDFGEPTPAELAIDISDNAIGDSANDNINAPLDSQLNAQTNSALAAIQLPEPNWPQLPPLPVLANQIGCPNYSQMPIWMRQQIYSLNIDLNRPVAQTINQLGNQRRLEAALTAVDPLQQQFQKLLNWRLSSDDKAMDFCKLSLQVDKIIDPFAPLDNGNSSQPSAAIFQQLIKTNEVVYSLAPENAVAELKHFLFWREFLQKNEVQIPDLMRQILNNKDHSVVIDSLNKIPIDAIYSMQLERKIISKKRYYIDHPYLGILVLITPVERPDVEALAREETQTEEGEENPVTDTQ